MKCFKAQISLMLKRNSFTLAFTVMCIFSALTFAVNCISHYGKYIIQVPAANYMFIGAKHNNFIPYILMNIFPVISSLAFSDTFFEEKKARTTEYCIMRTGNNKYFYSKLIAVFFSGFITVFVPLLLNIGLNLIAFPIDSTIDYTNFPIAESGVYGSMLNNLLILGDLLVFNEYLYIVVHALIISLSSALMAVITFNLSFFYNKSRSKLLCAVFLLYHIISIILNALNYLDLFNFSQFDFGSYLFAYEYSGDRSFSGLIITWGLLTAAAVIPIPFSKRRLRNIYD